MGCLYRRGKTYWIKYYRNGKPYAESTHSDKKEVAKRLLQKREGEIAEGKLPGICFEKVTFDELAEEYLTDYRVNERKSFARAEISVRHLRKHFEGYQVPLITTPKIQAYTEQRLNERAAHATVNHELKALRRMLNLGARQTPPKVDRVPYIPMLKENNTRKGFFEHGDFLALRDNLPDYLKGFVTFAYRSGWRLSEITNLKWRQVDLNQGIVCLEAGETKNDEARTLYLDAELKLVFFEQLKRRRTIERSGVLLPYVFPNSQGTGKIINIRKAWHTACQNAKIGNFLFHDFRRTAVRNMVRAGVPERVAMMVSGHKTRSVFERYNIVNSQDLKMAAEQQARYLEAQSSYKTVTIAPFPQKKRLASNS